MNNDQVRAALAELVACSDVPGSRPSARWKRAWAAAREALAEPADTAGAKQNAALLDALSDARQLVYDWTEYVPPYFRHKHGLAEDLARIDAAIAKAKT